MTCKCYYNPSLSSYTANAQTLAAGANVDFDVNSILTGTAISHVAGSPTVTISKPGIYFIFLDLDIEPTGAGPVTVQMLNNGVAMPDAVATFTGAADTISHIHLASLVRVAPSCCVMNNTANITVTVSAAASVTNAKIIVL